ncbi:hypothetical protein PoB_006725000 [Plakobranchus ocellatus]|uniref:Uncharacterized protein n=1 Tax=Plakobranchus ocellatus TaxID=259542 RepID=A0AAV4D9L7_9GAST|nr:hypothetical protein PoB_006725000 [Plakobranchus ocellatus]
MLTGTVREMGTVAVSFDGSWLTRGHKSLVGGRDSNSSLIQCERKATFNTNESFHSSDWAKYSKNQFHSMERVEIAVTSAAAEYKFGPSSVNELRGLLQNPAVTLRWIIMILTEGDFEANKIYDEHEMKVTVTSPRAVAVTLEDIQAALTALAGHANQIRRAGHYTGLNLKNQQNGFSEPTKH